VIEQHAVDAQPDLELRGAGFEVYIGGALQDGSFEELVDEGDGGRVLASGHGAGTGVRLDDQAGLLEADSGFEIIALPVEALDATVDDAQVGSGRLDVQSSQAAEFIKLQQIGWVHHRADEYAALDLHRKDLQPRGLAARDAVEGLVRDVEIEFSDRRNRVFSHRTPPCLSDR
jgi:hypothetical protein